MKNSLDRDNFIARFGKEKFEQMCSNKNSRYYKYREPPFPKQYNWIWNQFMFIWANCERDFNGNFIFTFQVINEYEKCMKIYFSVVEKKLLFKIKQWASEMIAELS